MELAWQMKPDLEEALGGRGQAPPGGAEPHGSRAATVEGWLALPTLVVPAPDAQSTARLRVSLKDSRRQRPSEQPLPVSPLSQ